MKQFVHRILARRRLKRELSLWYHPAYEVPELARTARTRGIVPDRGKSILSHLVQVDLVKPGDVEAPTGISIRDLKLVHTEEYLESVNKAETLARIFGLEPQHIEVDRFLRAQRMAVGGTLCATREVIKDSYPVAFNLGGGFHHAEPERGSGFCVFNDVAVTIAKIRMEGFKEQIGIVDLDFHQGNGNNAVFGSDNSVAQFSIQGSTWAPKPRNLTYEFSLPGGTDDEDYLDLLKEKLPRFLDYYRPKLLFYIAGNDVLAQDPLGEFALSVEGVLDRDKFVVEAAHERGIPMVITLAGGYSRHACLCSLNLILYLVGYPEQIHFDVEDDLHHYFSKISQSLDPTDLQKEDLEGFNLTEEDLIASLDGAKGPNKILGYYSAHGVELGLERYGFLPRLRDLGYRSLKVEVDPSDPSHQLIRILGRPKETPRRLNTDPDSKVPAQDDLMVLGEVVLKKEIMPFPVSTEEKKPLEFLTVEWLLLQDPQKPFTPHNPKFPGQKHPGLGLAEEVQELLLQMAKRIKVDGILIRPSFYHVAVGADHLYHFLDPKNEGTYRAIKEVVQDLPIDRASKQVHDEKLILDNGSPVSWIAGNQVCPFSQRLKDYFANREYTEAVWEEKHRLLQSGLHSIS